MSEFPKGDLPSSVSDKFILMMQNPLYFDDAHKKVEGANNFARIMHSVVLTGASIVTEGEDRLTSANRGIMIYETICGQARPGDHYASDEELMAIGTGANLFNQARALNCLPSNAELAATRMREDAPALFDAVIEISDRYTHNDSLTFYSVVYAAVMRGMHIGVESRIPRVVSEDEKLIPKEDS